MFEKSSKKSTKFIRKKEKNKNTSKIWEQWMGTIYSMVCVRKWLYNLNSGILIVVCICLAAATTPTITWTNSPHNNTITLIATIYRIIPNMYISILYMYCILHGTGRTATTMTNTLTQDLNLYIFHFYLSSIRFTIAPESG